MAEPSSLFGAAAGATPFGAAAQAVTAIASTPNTSKSGDIVNGPVSFGGISTGFGKIPTAAWIALALLAGLWILRRK